MDRIRSFPLSSPLSKFLNGLEILLAKAQVRRQLRETYIFSFILPIHIGTIIKTTENCLLGRIWGGELDPCRKFKE